MANILLTNHCVRSCPYCFAKKHMDGAIPDDIIKWEDIIYIADLFKASNEKHISLLGGEPTVHPDFIDIVLYLVERGFHVNVFTSGVMQDKMMEEAVKAFSKLTVRDFSFVVNFNDPKKTPYAELQSVQRFFNAFSRFTNIGFNIYREDFDMDFIFEYILRYGLKPIIRLGLAHRIPGIKNAHITPPNIRKMVEQFMTFVPTMERLGIKPGFDCGFPLCQFTNEEIGRLWKLMGTRFKFGCGPAIDIGPDMSIWTCFPLSSYEKKSIFDFNSVKEIGMFYKGVQDKVRKEVGGIYAACDTCEWREQDLCMGGCVAHALHAFIDEPESIRPKELKK